MKKVLSIIALVFALATTAIAATPIRIVEGTVTKVSDGDTIKVTTDDKTDLKVRLYGIDCPEIAHGSKLPGQPMGNEATEYLSKLIMGKRIKVKILAIDKYHRTVGEVLFTTMNVNRELVVNGYAEVYYVKKADKAAYKMDEATAKKNKLGIWSLSNYESPSVYRKRTKMSGN